MQACGPAYLADPLPAKVLQGKIKFVRAGIQLASTMIPSGLGNWG